MYNKPAHRNNSREIIGFAIVVFLFFIIFLRYGYLQVVRHDFYRTTSDNNRIRLQPIPPTRGYIYDRNGVLLADNKVMFSLVIDREYVHLKDDYIAALKPILDLTEDDLDYITAQERDQRGGKFKMLSLKANLTEKQLSRFSEVRYLFPGLSITTKMTRLYPHNELLAHVLGYVARINDKDQKIIDPTLYAGTELIGKGGIEKYYETALLGKPGFLSYEADAHGNIIRKLDELVPTRGDDLYLTIDYGIQKIATDAMAGRRGSVVALDPATGEVLALVSTPSFNPNLFVSGIRSVDYRVLNESLDRPLYNRSVQGQYPPGSTIKPFAGLGGINAGLVDWNYKISDPGFFSLPGDNHRFRDWKKTGHGIVDLDKAIYMSCDTYFYRLINRMGIDAYHDWMQHFGFGKVTGIDIPYEKSGLLPSSKWKLEVKKKKWIEGESMSVGIGQGYFIATPLQVALGTAITANKGKHLIPHVLKSTRGIKEVPIITQPDYTIPFKGTDEDWTKMHKAMTNVVDIGTARGLSNNLTGYKIAGKTGTAQVVGIAQGKTYNEAALNERHLDHAWFMGFAPADNPQIALAIIVENGKHGSTTAGPIAKAIFDYVVHQRTTNPLKPLNPQATTYEVLDAQAEVAVAEQARLAKIAVQKTAALPTVDTPTADVAANTQTIEAD